MQKDILFTHSYFLRFDPKEYRAMAPYPPLGTLYAASIARRLGYSVALFDSMLAGAESDILPLLRTHSPRIVVIYDDDFNYLTKMCLTRMREAAFRLSRLAHGAGCTVIVHGSDPVDHLQEYFDNGADYVLCGEGEQTLGELLDALLGGVCDPRTVSGIAFRSAQGVQRAPARPVMQNLDLFPFPAWDLVDAERYRSLWEKHHGHFSLNMVTTRGCPFHCNWCAKPLYGQVYNSRSPANVVDEMLLLRSALRPDHIWFCDDIFGLKPGWVREFSREVVRRRAVVPFKCLARVDLLLKDDMIADLRTAGCTSVWVGAESGSQKILDAMEKGTTVAQIYEASRRLKSAGIRTGFFLQYGYPGETMEDIECTLAMVHDCRPDDIGISVSYPLPGTKFFSDVRETLGQKHNWVDSQDLELMFPGEFHPDFYRALHRLTHKRLRMWQGFDQVRELARAPWRVSPGRLRRIVAMGYHWITLPPLRARMDALARIT
jgi:anaerobic magnesium-protoporphyrin IX monomethyl ester cyclase